MYNFHNYLKTLFEKEEGELSNRKDNSSVAYFNDQVSKDIISYFLWFSFQKFCPDLNDIECHFNEVWTLRICLYSN